MRELTITEMEANLRKFLEGEGKNRGLLADARYASFDYCFNYFQSFRGRASELISEENLEHSCLQLGFYLASWGMMRGSTELLQKSVRHLAHTIEVIAKADDIIWQVDIDRYSEENITRVLDLSDCIKSAICDQKPASDTLSTKIMLGVFGNVPAFDSYFKRGFRVYKLNRNALHSISNFYSLNPGFFDRKISTIEFNPRVSSRRIYTKAKLLDMLFFIEGAK